MDDLSFLATVGLFKNCRVVGLGESSHGVREFSQIKISIFRKLVDTENFNVLAMEISEKSALHINRYLQGENGDLRDILLQTGYWMLYTQEMVELLDWMKEYNFHHVHAPLRVYGCDIPTDDPRRKVGLSIRDESISSNILSKLSENSNNKIVIWAHNSHVSYLNIPTFRTAGSFLKHALNEEYMNVGMYFFEGEFLAINENDRKLRKFSVPVHSSMIAFSQDMDGQFCLVDFREDETEHKINHKNSALSSIFEVGAVYNPDYANDYIHSIRLSELFDVAVFVKTGHPSSLIS